MNLLKHSLSILTVLSLGVTGASANTLSTYVDGSNEFGFQVFKELAKKEGTNGKNILYSPISMNMAFSMLTSFTSEKEQSKILKAMSLDGITGKQFIDSTSALIENFEASANDRYKVKLANSTWVDSRFQLKKSSLINNIMNVFRMDLSNELSFAGNSQGSADKMNEWVNTATEERIPTLVSAKEVEPLDWAFINATYLEGKWFDKYGIANRGRPASFSGTGGRNGEAVYITGTSYDGVFGADLRKKGGYSVLEFPFGEQVQGQAEKKYGSLIIVHPENADGLKSILAQLDLGFFKKVMKQLEDEKTLGRDQNIAVEIPAFDLAYETGMDEVKSVLTEQGAGHLFDAFDLTGLHNDFSAGNGNHIKLIKQKANITVANEGTTAAAATIVGGGIRSMGPMTIEVNSAFLYFVVDGPSQAITFVGALTSMNDVKTPKMELPKD